MDKKKMGGFCCSSSTTQRFFLLHLMEVGNTNNALSMVLKTPSCSLYVLMRSTCLDVATLIKGGSELRRTEGGQERSGKGP